MDKVCFLISPIGKEGSDVRTNADEVMKYIIEPACAAFNYKVIRADKMSNTGLITKAIIEQIISADLVIADLTDNNPNVFYELAIRHSYRKPAIQIIKGEVNIPFDIANMRIYNDFNWGSYLEFREVKTPKVSSQQIVIKSFRYWTR